MIGRQNNESQMLEQQLKAFFYAGSYFRYTRWTMDERLCDPVYEDLIDWDYQQVVPHRYSCPNCGTDNPTQITADMPEPPGAISDLRRDAERHLGVKTKRGWRNVALSHIDRVIDL